MRLGIKGKILLPFGVLLLVLLLASTLVGSGCTHDEFEDNWGVCIPVQAIGNVTAGNDSFLINSCCLLYTSPSPRDRQRSRMPSSA